MSSLAYRNTRGDGYSTQEQSQQAAQGFGQAVDPAVTQGMWEARNSDLIKQWLALDPVTQARAADELGLAPVINSGLLPNPQQLAELVATAQRLQGTVSEDVPGLGVSPGMLSDAEVTLSTARAQTEAATGRYMHYEAQGSSGWGAAEGVGAEWMADDNLMHGELQRPNPALQKDANEAIGKLESLINQGEGASRVELLAQQRLAEERSQAWAAEVDRYVQGREVGGEHAVDGLEYVRDESYEIIKRQVLKNLPTLK